MKLIRIDEMYGVYKILNKSSKYTSRGTRCYDCICTICGNQRTFSESYLKKLAKINECICDKEQRNLDIKKEFDYITKNYGKVNLCGSCKYMFRCAKYRYNAVNTQYMKKYSIETVKDYKKRRKLILVFECDKFEFDWGTKK